MFIQLWGAVLSMISWWIVLFTGSYPESFFEYQVKNMRWALRVTARQLNLAEGSPSFGLDGEDEVVKLEVAYPESLSRGDLLLKTFFGVFYVGIPHGIILVLRLYWGMILGLFAFFSILFSGTYPVSWFEFNVGTLRWMTRVNLYMKFMTDEYPPFSSKA